jgi:hypothetical protein
MVLKVGGVFGYVWATRQPSPLITLVTLTYPHLILPYPDIQRTIWPPSLALWGSSVLSYILVVRLKSICRYLSRLSMQNFKVYRFLVCSL